MCRYALIILAVLTLVACASAPLAINEGVFSGETPASVLKKESGGERVRWGGVIVSVSVGIGESASQAETCFEILGRPLDEEGEPRPTETTEGRFVACAGKSLDPAAYPEGRHFTVSGTVQAPVTCKIGDHPRRCPLVKIDALHLWAKRVYSRGSCNYDPFWGPRNVWPWYYR